MIKIRYVLGLWFAALLSSAAASFVPVKGVEIFCVLNAFVLFAAAVVIVCYNFDKASCGEEWEF